MSYVTNVNSTVAVWLFGLLYIGYTYSNNCEDLVYMKIELDGKLFNSTGSGVNVNSPQQCLEMCRDQELCKSVGIESDSMMCYLYDNRVYSGSPGIDKDGMVYYWLLEDECPVHLGYNEDTNNKICSKHNSSRVVWRVAQNQCELDGGHLLIVDTEAKRTVLNQYILDGVLNNTYTTLGSTNAVQLEWLNGAHIDSGYFAISQPNIGSGDQCVVIHDDADGPYSGLHDASCENNKYGFICEVPTKLAYIK